MNYPLQQGKLSISWRNLFSPFWHLEKSRESSLFVDTIANPRALPPPPFPFHITKLHLIHQLVPLHQSLPSFHPSKPTWSALHGQTVNRSFVWKRRLPRRAQLLIAPSWIETGEKVNASHFVLCIDENQHQMDALNFPSLSRPRLNFWAVFIDHETRSTELRYCSCHAFLVSSHRWSSHTTSS